MNKGKISIQFLSAAQTLTGSKHLLKTPEMNILIDCGTEETRGRAIRDGAHEVKIHGKYYRVKAEVRDISSLSDHADQSEMLNWLKGFEKKSKKIFLVHGELTSQDIFRLKIEDELKLKVEIPRQYEELEI